LPHDVLPTTLTHAIHAVDARDSPLAMRTLEDHADVVAPRDGRIPLVEADASRPLAEDVEVVREVHHVHEVSATTARANLPEDDLAFRSEEPFHVREACPHLHRIEDVEPELDPPRELWERQIAERDLRRTDPLVRTRLKRTR